MDKIHKQVLESKARRNNIRRDLYAYDNENLATFTMVTELSASIMSINIVINKS